MRARSRGHTAISAVVAVIAALAAAVPAALAAGELDESFSGDGKVLTDVGGIDAARDVALGPSGTIIAAGAAGPYDTDPFNSAIVRYTADGELDPSFADGGKLLAGRGSILGRLGINGIELQDDGKIVVGGTTPSTVAAARFTSDGDPDPSFSGDGLVTTDLPGFENGVDVGITPEGRIVLAGHAKNGSGDLAFAAVRYTPDGELDSSFSDDGIAVAPRTVGRDNWAGGAALQPDGKLVIAGGATGRHRALAVARFTHDGRLDRAFGGDGLVRTRFRRPAFGHAVAVQANGRIVAVGSEERYDGDSDLVDLDFAATRYRKNGRLDRSFSKDGRRTFAFARRDRAWDDANAVAELPGGRLVVAGVSGTRKGEFALAVLRTRDGAFVRSFGRKGKLLTDFGSPLDDHAEAIAVQPDGGFVVAGGQQTWTGTDFANVSDFALARYLPVGRSR